MAPVGLESVLDSCVPRGTVRLVHTTDPSQNKSNRAGADVFELELIRNLSLLYEVPFSYGQQLARRRADTQRAHPADGAERVAVQWRRAQDAAVACIDEFDQRINAVGDVAGVVWEGRDNHAAGVGDVVVEHVGCGGATAGCPPRTILSCKSIGRTTGEGTQKNLGGKALRSLLGVDIDTARHEMYRESRVALQLASDASVAQVKRTAKQQPDGRRRVVAVGRRHRDQLVAATLARAQRLSQQQASLLLEVIEGTDADFGPDDVVYLVMANPQGTTVEPAHEHTGHITFERTSDSSIGLSVDGQRVYSLQFNCTNGLGVSPLCVRVFYVKGSVGRDAA